MSYFQSQQQKSNTSVQPSQQSLCSNSEYGGQQRLVLYANKGRDLNPQAELNLAKDYNTKINQLNKVPKPKYSGEPTMNFDDRTKTTLKENLEKINQLYKNNPTLKVSDPITQQSYPTFQEKNHIKKTPLSDIDNVKSVNNNPTTVASKPNSKFNYESTQNDWKSSSRNVQPRSAITKELFEKRELKNAELKPQNRNPIINESEIFRLSKNQSQGTFNNGECKRLLQNDYGQDLKYKEEKSMANKVNSFQSQERKFNYNDVNQGDYRKKQSEFENKNKFLRGQ